MACMQAIQNLFNRIMHVSEENMKVDEDRSEIHKLPTPLMPPGTVTEHPIYNSGVR